MEGKIVEDKKKMLFHLFISTLYLSAFTFGGGYDCFPVKEKICGRISLD